MSWPEASTTARLILTPISLALAIPAASIFMLASCVTRWVAAKSAIRLLLLFGCCSARRRQGRAAAHLAAFDHLGIDAHIDVPEIFRQRQRQVEIARAAVGIDIGRGAAPDRFDAAQRHVAEREIAADPVEFLPGRAAREIEIRAKAARIEGQPDLLRERAER